MLNIFLWNVFIMCVFLSKRQEVIHEFIFFIYLFISIFFFFWILGLEFLSLLFIVVYIGSIIILFIFVLMMINISYVNTKLFFVNIIPIIVFFILFILIMNKSLWIKQITFDQYVISSIGITSISYLFNIIYAWLFIVSSIILLLSMLGIISLVN